MGCHPVGPHTHIKLRSAHISSMTTSSAHHGGDHAGMGGGEGTSLLFLWRGRGPEGLDPILDPNSSQLAGIARYAVAPRAVRNVGNAH